MLHGEHADAFKEAWALHDPTATGSIHVKHLAAVVKALPPPLGLDPKGFKHAKIRVVDVARCASSR